MKKRLLFFLTILFASHMLLAQRDEGARPKGAVYDNPVPPSGAYYHTEGTITEWSASDLSGWKGKNWSLVGGAITTGAYKAGQVSLLESPVIQLPALTRKDQRINAYFNESFELESGYDKGVVQVSADNGATWKILSSRDGRGASRTTSVNLTEYAGKSIRLSFRLTADGTNQYKGWNVQNLAIKQESLSDPLTSSIASYASRTGRAAAGGGVMPMGVGTLGGAMNSVDAQKFPTFIFAQLTVTNSGVPLLSLDESNFFVREYVQNANGGADTLDAPRDETFLVFKPTDSITHKPVDIVFLMDNSGSMSDEQAAVANNVEAFCNQLATTSFNYQLGLCRFGQGASSGVPIFQNNAGWYTSTTDFVTMWRGTNVTDGANEPSWDALYQSSTQFPFRAGSQRIFILITDESITGNNLPINIIKDRQVVIDQLLATGVKAYTLVPQISPFDSDFGAISTATNGRTYDIFSPFNDILQDIADQIQGTYVVRYSPPFKDFDGKTRNVEIKVKHNGNTLPLTGTYTPGIAPTVIRTDATIALHANAQLNNQPLTISVNTFEWNPAYPTNRVSLFYRTAVPFGTTPNPVYTEAAMVKGTSTGTNPVVTTWTYTIPANRVVGPGIQYYVKATNRFNGSDFLSATAPEVIDRPGYPYSIAVLPNLPPVATHTPVTSVPDPKTSSIYFSVTAVDNTTSVASVKLSVSTNLGGSYTDYVMTTSGNNLYEYTLPPVGGSGGTVLYYIQVTDNFGVTTDVGSLAAPFPIAVGVPFVVAPTSKFQPINILKSTSPITPGTATFRGAPLADGDVVAAVYTENGIVKTAGKLTWSTTAGANSMTVYGNTAAAGSPKNGYNLGENLSFSVWRKATNEILNADYLVYTAPPATTTSPSLAFAVGGRTSTLREIVALPEHVISLDEGINLWSTYMTPRFASFEYVLRPLASIQPTVSNANGDSYTYGDTNSPLPNYTTGQGYATVLNAPVVLRVKGTEPSAPYPSVSVNGQGIIGTPYRTPQNVERVILPTQTAVFTVDRYLKDGAGNFTIETYSPLLGFNDWTYKNMEPGKGYWVTTDGGQVTVNFPNAAAPYPARVASKQATVEKLPQTITSIDRYMTVLISKDAQKDVQPGSVIRVYNSTGKVVGKAIAQEQGVSIAVDGTLMKDQEPFTLRVFNKTTNVEKYLAVTSWVAGNGTYQNRKPAVPGATRVTATEEGGNLIIFPNPLTNESSISFKNAVDQNVKIEIFDTQGSKVLHTVADQYFTKGAHTITIQRQSLPSGLYVIRKTSGASVETTRIMVK